MKRRKKEKEVKVKKNKPKIYEYLENDYYIIKYYNLINSDIFLNLFLYIK